MLSKMNNSELVQIADILPPTAPASPSVDFSLVFFLLIAVVTVVGLWYRRSSKQQLKRLCKQYQQRRINNRRCAFQLSDLLRKKRLLRQDRQYQEPGATTLSAQQKNQSWQEYSATLQVACYSRRGLDDDAMSQLLRESARWL